MSATTDRLRHALRELAADLSGIPADLAPDERSELLLAAALLTGRGDLAQDALHIATCRVHLAHPDGPLDRMALQTELLRTGRELTDPLAGPP